VDELDQRVLAGEGWRDLESVSLPEHEGGAGAVDAYLLDERIRQVLRQGTEGRHRTEHPPPEGGRSVPVGRVAGEPVLLRDDAAHHAVHPLLVLEPDPGGAALAESLGELKLDRP